MLGSQKNSSKSSSHVFTPLNLASLFLFVSVIFLQETLINWKWRWKRSNLSTMEQQQFSDCMAITSVHITSELDRWIWIKDEDHGFSVKSMKNII